MSELIEPVPHYSFAAEHLRVGERRPGISAFMRIRNGAFSLEAAIRSHIGHFDEIVAVYNRCTDATPDILARLAAEFGGRLRVWHYLPEVHPPGSSGHRATPADHPQSLVNYYNFALSRTRFTHVTKLDDDHVAMAEATAKLVSDVRGGRAANREMACFSGLNLARDRQGQVGLLASEPFSGAGDIGIFPVLPGTHFGKDRRFEVLRFGLPRRFHSHVYWHLKYLKPDLGFGNYDLAQNPTSRYARRFAALAAGPHVAPLASLAELGPDWREHCVALGLPLPPRDRLLAARRAAARRGAAAFRPEAEPALAPFLNRDTGPATQP